ncbi:MAG: ABC transporter permease [Chloroflexota bacterium]
MDLSAPWDKILHDIWSNKARSLLVVFTIAIGIAAVGMINTTVTVMKRDMSGQFAERNPASILIYVSPFQEKLAADVRSMREIEYAEAQRTTEGFIISENEKPASSKTRLNLRTFPDFSDLRINQLRLEKGSASPGLRGILLERTTAVGLKVTVGDPVWIEMNDGKQYRLTVSGIVHDMSTQPYNITGEALGYVTMPTLEWLGERPYYNQIKVVVAQNKSDREHVLTVAAAARDRIIEPGGYQVAAMQIPGAGSLPGEFWGRRQVDGILLVFQVMSVLAILLSGGLVVNTVSAVLVQQVKQIGIMRSVGAARSQIVRMYLAYVLVLSLLGLVIALPLGVLGAWGLTSVAANFMNFNTSQVSLPTSILFLQVGLGIFMPLGVALSPILRGTRISVYDAIYEYGLGEDGERKGVDSLLVRLRHLSPPVMLSLRNTFRNKSRLAFTLITLTVAGAMFMAVFSSYATLAQQVREFGRYIAFDVSINIPGGASKYTAEREALRVPGVKVAEGWASSNGFIVHPDGSESDRVEVVGLPQASQTVQPLMVKGRWLQAGDTSQVVINEDILVGEPGISLGDNVVLKVDNTERTYQVVGIVSKHMMSPRIYMHDEQFAKLTGRYNQVDSVRVLMAPGAFTTASQQSQVGKELEKRFEDAKLSQSSSKTRSEIFSALSDAFDILSIVLMLVAGILAVIGGLGLTGAMGINVLERRREIGVLRAVGASHSSVRQVVVVEGVVVALLSWMFSAFLSYPVGWALAVAIVRVSLDTDASFRYSLPGLLAWLVVVVLIGVFSSLVPARDAARLTVREVLSYE